MLKPINSAAQRIADGRRYAARSIVMTNFSSVACYFYRRQIVSVENNIERDESIFPDGYVLSGSEHHATEYEYQGVAMALMDRFVGGSMHYAGDDVNSGENVMYAQIEPFHEENYGKASDMMRNKPDWSPKKGDVMAMVIDEDLIKWAEVVGVTGQNLQSNHGEKYVLNIRDKLMHLDPFKLHEDMLKPEMQIFPTTLDQLLYSDVPMYVHHVNDPNTLRDDVIEANHFKLVNFTDPQMARLPGVMAVTHMRNKTNSDYFFNAMDQQKISVDLVQMDRFRLQASDPVSAIEANGAFITYFLIMIDHPTLVPKIRSELLNLHDVQLFRNDSAVFDLLPIHFDEVRKAYQMVIVADLGAVNEYQLKFIDQSMNTLVIDLTDVQAV